MTISTVHFWRRRRAAGLDGAMVPHCVEERRWLDDCVVRPENAAGQEANWVQTWPGKGFNVIFRLYRATAGVVRQELEAG